MDKKNTDNGGWICLHRAIQKHWLRGDSNLFGAWVSILLEVNHAPKKVLIKGKLLNVNRGESVKSLESWAKVFGKGWNRDKVHRYFKVLKKDNMIATVNEGVTLRLSVTNYDKYQTRPTVLQQFCNGHATEALTNNNDNNEEQEEVGFRSQRELDVWRSFVEHRKEIKSPMTERAMKIARNKLFAISEGRSIATMEQSIEGGWQGLFPDKVPEPQINGHDLAQHQMKKAGLI